MRTGLALACILHVSTAFAAGTAWSEGAYARVVHERDVVLVDGEIEHLIVQARFQSDAKVHALVVPMPAQPLAENGFATEDDLVFGRLESITRYDDPALVPDAPEMETIPQSTMRTAQGTVIPDPNALADWLKLEQLPQRASLIAWAKGTGHVLNAVKLADDDAPEPVRIVQSPALRFSFKTSKLELPYTETPPEDAETARFELKKHAIKSHAMDVWVVSTTPVDLLPKSNLERRATTRVTSVDLEGAIGKIASFDPKSHPSWVITRFAERSKTPRSATSELQIVPGQMRASVPPGATTRSHHRAWLALALGLVLAIAFALRRN